MKSSKWLVALPAFAISTGAFEFYEYRNRSQRLCNSRRIRSPFTPRADILGGGALKGKKYEAKRNHHYVWADYLRRWSNDQKNIWHTTPTGKVRLDSIKSLSKQEFFYKAGSLTAEHLEIIRQYSSKSPKYVQEQHVRFLQRFMEIQLLERYQAADGSRSEMKKAVHILKCNTLEDQHAHHEREARAVLSSLAEGDFSTLADSDNLLKFLVYFGHQTSRTKSFKDSYLAIKPRLVSEGDEAARMFRRSEECWWFLSYIFGMNIGWSLYSNRSSHRFCLLINETQRDFVTSDQPIINVHPDLVEGAFTPPNDETCDFLYPISPKVAFMVNRSDSFPNGVTKISESFVHDMNQRVAKASDINIFGATREAVEDYKSLVGYRKNAAIKHFATHGSGFHSNNQNSEH